MALPAAYTEWALADYCHKTLGTVAGILGWTVEDDSYSEVVNDVLLSMSGSALADMTSDDQLREVRALAKYAAWVAAVDSLVALYDFSADGGSYSRSQAVENAIKARDAAGQAAFEWLPEYQATAEVVTYHGDPYADYDDNLYPD